MKRIFLLAAALTALFVPVLTFAHGGDTYVASMSGIECNDCKKKIASSIAKIKGVKTIRISKVTETSHKLTVVTDGSVSISAARAKKALPKGGHYKITSWTKAAHSH